MGAIYDAEIESLLKRAGALIEEAARLEAEPEDDHAVGTLITWEQEWTARHGSYTYAAVKYSETSWATSGPTGRLLSWRGLWRQHLSRATPGSVYWASELTPEEW